MKYVLAGLAVVAAVAALFFRPPQVDLAASSSTAVAPPVGVPSPGVPSLGISPDPRAAASEGSPVSLVRASGARTAARAPLVVYVAGEVVKPGVYELPAGARAQAALARAGGPKPDADLVAVNLAARVDDGAEIVFPKIGQATPRASRATGARVRSGKASSSPSHRRGRRARPPIAPARSIDLNSADADELQAVPGLGPALAARIVAYREANGPFGSVDELADVSGITPSLQAKLADFIVVHEGR